MHFAYLESEEYITDELVIDPLWMLAGWSVDFDSTVDASRFSTILHGPNSSSNILETEEEVMEFYIILVAIAQAMSLISYELVVLNSSTTYDRSMNHVWLDNWVTRRVWAYGLGTRTSRPGVGVIWAGVVMVGFRVVFAVYNHRSTSKKNFIQLAASP
ncbi:hypothetical protein MMC29_005671 [Sticta canariensis]|nr:hypothetical protein [Sticta canariensis]